MKSIYARVFVISLFLSGSAVFAQTRLPDIPLDEYSAEQKVAAQEFEAARKKSRGAPLPC